MQMARAAQQKKLKIESALYIGTEGGLSVVFMDSNKGEGNER